MQSPLAPHDLDSSSRSLSPQPPAAPHAGPDAAAPAFLPAFLQAGRPRGGSGGTRWDGFLQGQSQQLARGIQVSAALFLAVVLACRFQVGAQETQVQEAHSAIVLVFTIAAMLATEDLAASGLSWLASLLILVLKLSAATSPLFRSFSVSLFQQLPATTGPPLLCAALARLCLGNHIALLLVLGTAMPQGILADTVAQLLFFASLFSQTGDMCDTPYMRETLKTTAWVRSLLGDKRTCVMAIATTQLWIGVLLPLLLSVRREASAGVHFARRNGIPHSDRRVQAYSWLYRASSLGDRLSLALAAALVSLYAVWAAVAWAYLGSVYK